MTVQLELTHTPASAVQRQMWVVDTMDQQACVYNEHLAFWLDGSLDVDALEAAWNELVARHEVLRLVFSVRDGELFQAVLPEHRCVFDRATFGTDDEASTWGGQLVERRYDLSVSPMAIGIAAVSDDRHLFVIGFHHAVMDAGSIGLLFEELSSRYRGRLLDDPVPCRPDDLGYTDYVAWTRSPEYAARVEQLLPDVLATLRDPATRTAEIAGDHGRPVVKSTRGSLAEAPFPAGIVPRLRRYAATHRVTPFHVLLAGMGALIQRCSGTDDLVLGVGSSGRPAEFARTVGPFSCVVPVRLAVPADARFDAVAETARDAALRLETTQFLPFSRVVSEVVEGRDASRTPLIQIVFNAPPLHFAEDTLDGSRLSAARLPRSRSRFDLLVNLEWHGDDVVGTAEYDSEIFEHATVVGLLGQLGELVDAAVADEDVTVDAIALPRLAALVGTSPTYPAAAPHTPTTASGSRLEGHLLQHITDLLDGAPVAATDDFFAVGGHSMLAARLTQRLSEEFDAEVPLLAVFEHPVVADLAAELDRLFPEFETVLAEAAALTVADLAELAEPSELEELSPESAESTADADELSPHEEPFWLLEQFAPGSAVNTLTLRIAGRGPLDVAAFEGAFGDVVERHEILRTSYRTAPDSSARRIIHPQVSASVTEVDGSAGAVAERECRTGFDVSAAPLVRATVVHTGPGSFEVVLSCHHLVMDYWGVTHVMLPDLATFYRARVSGLTAELPPAEGYRAAVARELGWQHGPQARAERRYWADRLTGMTTLDLPTDRPRPATPEFGGAVVASQAGPELRTGVADYARAHQTTTFAVLSAVTAACLQRRTGGEDTFLLCPVENRRAEVDSRVMGTFVNLVALRYRSTGATSLADLVTASRETVLGAYTNQGVPIAEALGLVGLENVISSGHGRYCVLNVFSADTGLELEGCEIGTGAIVAHDAAGTDLELSVTESAAGFDLLLKYRPSLWDEASMQDLVDEVVATLEALLADDTALLADDTALLSRS